MTRSLSQVDGFFVAHQAAHGVPMLLVLDLHLSKHLENALRRALDAADAVRDAAEATA